MFHIKVDGKNILNVVDSWIPPSTMKYLEAYSWDLVLWPFQTMRELEVLQPSRAEPATGEIPVEWIEQLKILQPRTLVPSSCQFIHEAWSWYNHSFFPISYKGFAEQMNKIIPDTKILRLDPGFSVEMRGTEFDSGKRLPWIELMDRTEVDYCYRSDLFVPTTEEISKNFKELREEELARVKNYCELEIPVLHAQLAHDDESYFNKLRNWRLKIFDHRGLAISYYYEICCDQMVRVEGSSLPLGWTTELPAAKLYAALINGESLTSLYLRINDQRFSPEIESEFNQTDIFEDPLVRCLYSGSIAGYQRAQLRKIFRSI